MNLQRKCKSRNKREQGQGKACQRNGRERVPPDLPVLPGLTQVQAHNFLFIAFAVSPVCRLLLEQHPCPPFHAYLPARPPSLGEPFVSAPLLCPICFHGSFSYSILCWGFLCLNAVQIHEQGASLALLAACFVQELATSR